MKKSRSLIFYKFLIDSSWYIGIAVCGIWAIICLVSVLSEQRVMGTDLISFELELKSPHPDVSSLSKVFNFAIDKPAKLTATLEDFKIDQVMSPFAVSYFLFLFVGLIISFYQLKQMKDLLNDVIKGEIFTSTNAFRLRMFGISELLYIPVNVIYYYITAQIFKHSTYLNSELRSVLDVHEINQLLIHGLEYLIFAGIFAFGCKLKQENDLTI
ncbi:DUF2975 domain-containing protein [Pedobacter agri]|uniref:DUF2975 domain-containing protein n=1 Tax=Pedobacter agri TaxID=454586 RepID=UPI002930A0A4|nr:DUF2975 domain-containing protein [Pedobacter agri]